jgi:hypothetical protein
MCKFQNRIWLSAWLPMCSIYLFCMIAFYRACIFKAFITRIFVHVSFVFLCFRHTVIEIFGLHLLFEFRPINYLFRNRWCLTQRKRQRTSNGQSGIDNLERTKSTKQLTWYRATRTQRKIRGFRRVSSSCMIFSNTLLLRKGIVECTHTTEDNWWCVSMQPSPVYLSFRE